MQDNTNTPAPDQLDSQPGKQEEMNDQPQTINPDQLGSGKLAGKVALITGGDSGIGRAVAIAYAKEGADIFIGFLDEVHDAEETKAMVEAEGGRCEILAGDVGDSTFCHELVEEVVKAFGGIDIVVNNAGEQHPQEDFSKITPEQLLRTFQTNIFSMFYITQAALPHLKDGSAIINTASITAYKGNPMLVDYSATKGAIVAFTRSLSQQLADKGIRVNAVAPGPIWTPLIPSTFSTEQVDSFGKDTPMQRAGQPSEVGGAFVFLASSDASYISGQTIHVNGGSVVGS